MQHDYSQFQTETKPGEEAFKRLTSMVDQLEESKKEVKEQEDALKRAQERVRDLEEKQIPELLEEMNLEKFTMADGRKIELKTTIRTSITNENKAKAYQWLQDNGHDALIKRNITVSLGRDRANQAMELIRNLEDAEYENVSQTVKVEPPTLKAFVTEQLEMGAEIPMDLFSVFPQKRVKVK